MARRSSSAALPPLPTGTAGTAHAAAAPHACSACSDIQAGALRRIIRCRATRVTNRLTHCAAAPRMRSLPTASSRHGRHSIEPTAAVTADRSESLDIFHCASLAKCERVRVRVCRKGARVAVEIRMLSGAWHSCGACAGQF
eukprot:TRINITY_DN15737_c0_g1_i1.p1 TRINITY_DN15737_c0_g1~~TRINITY_DN15737_c0_g1_i1.p1  ORF type:complete len:141 (-),score=6.01 TRINITY_DN15737_c0_g1_i1:3-425(-)